MARGAGMKPMDAGQFELARKRMLRRFGRISGANAKGFLVDLDGALAKAGLTRVKTQWRGDPDWGFTATGEYEGSREVATAAVIQCLVDDVAYGGTAAPAPVGVTSVAAVGDRVQLRFLTWHPEIGAASVRIDLGSR